MTWCGSDCVLEAVCGIVLCSLSPTNWDVNHSDAVLFLLLTRIKRGPR